MKKKVTIELFEEHKNVNFYTLKFENENTEVIKFINKFPNSCQYGEDLNIIINWIDKIGQKGALERYFRPEGKYSDNVLAIPIETSNLRLYVIRITENLIVLGNGDKKTTRSYNEDEILTSYVELLQSINGYIRHRLSNGSLQILNGKLYGNLTFYH